VSDNPSGPMEVLLVVDDDILRRLGNLPRLICVGMVDEPIRMTVLTADYQEKMDDALGPARFFGLPCRIWPWHGWSAAEIEEEFEIDPPHVVHCLSPAVAGWVRDWVRDWDSRLLVSLTDLVDVDRFGEIDLPENTLAAPFSRRVEDHLLQRYPGMQGATRTIPIGLPALAEPLCLSQPDRIPAIVITVPLTRDSGVDRVLRAMQALVQNQLEVQLFILSTGPAEHSLRRLAERLSIVPHVTFSGPMPDWNTVLGAMRGADLYLMPNVPRRYSITRLAALASGLAVIAPVGSVEDYLIDGTTAVLFDPQRSGQLTDRWIELLEDPGVARQLAQRALDYVRTHHQASTMIGSLASLYRELRGWPASAVSM